jgi:hypothetical protein
MRFVGKQSFGFEENSIFIRTDQPDSAVESFLTLGLFAHDENRFAERRRFFLNTAGVRQDKRRAAHQGDERFVRLRSNQTHIRKIAEDSINRLLNARVEMHRVDDVQFWMPFSQCRDGSADCSNPSPKLSRRCPVTRM